jgi:signal transduction histidine kinase
MELQRRRLTEEQLADGQSTLRLRRVLHDDILPRLHAAMLMMNGDEAARADAQTQLTDAHREISGLLRAMPSALPSSLAQHGLFGALRQAIAEEFPGKFDEVVWQISPEAQAQATELSPLVAETIFHAAREAVRNAARYARGATEADGTNTPTVPLYLLLKASTENGFEVLIEDNGIGVSGEYSVGTGQGLALHSTMMAVAGGALSVESTPARGTRVRLSLSP